MTASPFKTPSATPSPALSRLLSFLTSRRGPNADRLRFEDFEHKLHVLVQDVEAEALTEELARQDIDLPLVEIAGKPHRLVLVCEQTYMSCAGPIRVARRLYSSREKGAHTVCPMELRAGIVEGFWTPRAAKQATFLVTHLTPKESCAVLRELGGMNPSKSSLDRLPKQLSLRWEADREGFEQQLRAPEKVPKAAVTVAVSLDGVLCPMKDGERAKKREAAQAEGKRTRGPAGYQEVGCATLSFYDKDGERLKTLRLARMPEPNKETLKKMLKAELFSVLEARPDLRLAKLADGAKDNWTYLEEALPEGESALDFYHAAQNLYEALCAAYGEASLKTQAQFEKLRRVLRDDPEGVTKVIRALCYLRKKHPRRQRIRQALAFFRRNRERMRYAELRVQGMPIGSGVVEAACKTLATARLKRSGMRWSPEGGQAILTWRSLVQSERFERGWALLAKTYTAELKPLGNVVPLRAW